MIIEVLILKARIMRKARCLLCIVDVWSLTLYQKGRSMLFRFESPLKSKFINYKQVVNLTLPYMIRREN